MGYNLTIDQGNSAAKVVVWHGDTLVAVSHHQVFSAEVAMQLVRQYSIDSVIYSSVAKDGHDIIDSLREIAQGTVIELSHTTPLPITLDYATPHTLGRDRIAAAVGAHMQTPCRTVLVIDMGTAVTYDVVTADGRFAGGNIAPGVKMRLDALHHFTARLPQVNVDDNERLWGCDTESAMLAGALHGVAAEVSYYRSKLPADVVVMLTGGSASGVAKLLDFDTVIDPHLVNKGLNCILKYNENK